MGRKILVSVDLSDHSKEVLNGAQSMAQKDEELVILYVIPDPSKFAGFVVPHRSTDKMREELKEEAEKRMKGFVDHYAPEASYRVEFGTPSEEIVRIARDENADLIVIGSHQSTGWMDTLFSSHIREKVASQASCTVEIIPIPFETEEELEGKPRI